VSRADWEAFVAAVDLSRMPVPMTLKLEKAHWPENVRLVLRSVFRDVDNSDKNIPVYLAEHANVDEDPAKVGTYLVRSMLERTFVHEIEECLFVAGIRVCDPHPELTNGH